MKRYPLMIAAGLILVLSVVLVSGRAFSERNPQMTGDQLLPTPVSVGSAGTIVVGSPMPTPPPNPTVVFPTVEPLPAAPELDPVLANEQEIAFYDFDTGDLSDWTFGQITPDPAGVVAWELADGQLASPYNDLTMYLLNDVLAIAPTNLEGAGAIEAQVALNLNTHAGLMLGYADDQNYLVALFGSADAPRYPGITLMHVLAGQATVLASDPDFTVDPGWHNVRLEYTGDTATMMLDGDTVATGMLPSPLIGGGVGAYAGSDGGALFDNVRVVQK